MSKTCAYILACVTAMFASGCVQFRPPASTIAHIQERGAERALGFRTAICTVHGSSVRILAYGFHPNEHRWDTVVSRTEPEMMFEYRWMLGVSNGRQMWVKLKLSEPTILLPAVRTRTYSGGLGEIGIIRRGRELSCKFPAAKLTDHEDINATIIVSGKIVATVVTDEEFAKALKAFEESMSLDVPDGQRSR